MNKKKKTPIAKSTVLGPAFAGNLLRIREREGLTQENVAARAGFVTSYVSMLERGIRTPTLETIEHLARALGLKHPTEFFRERS